MTSVYSAVGASSAAAMAANSKVGQGMGAMDATDFLKLLTAQMTMQDPTAPVDNKDMLAQMAQFTSLSTSSEMNSTLKAIAAKLGVTDMTAASTDDTSTSGVTA
jgi:flagellar basal-body rod modification protein FlgD